MSRIVFCENCKYGVKHKGILRWIECLLKRGSKLWINFPRRCIDYKLRNGEVI